MTNIIRWHGCCRQCRVCPTIIIVNVVRTSSIIGYSCCCCCCVSCIHCSCIDTCRQFGLICIISIQITINIIINSMVNTNICISNYCFRIVVIVIIVILLRCFVFTVCVQRCRFYSLLTWREWSCISAMTNDTNIILHRTVAYTVILLFVIGLMNLIGHNNVWLFCIRYENCFITSMMWRLCWLLWCWEWRC